MPASPVLFGLTALGLIHAIAGLAAIAAAIGAYRLDKEIRLDRPWAYLALTLFTAASALFIMQHGGFTKAHGLALLTLGALAVGLVGARGHSPACRDMSRRYALARHCCFTPSPASQRP
jgi:uncharacterized membrane protein